MLITRTRNDKAVGIAYPIASRINGVTAAALGDANDSERRNSLVHGRG
jgi:hypothetical protein